ncbi:MAG: hypothetical protein ACQESZ_08150, partial [Bacteroidota bacterium]
VLPLMVVFFYALWRSRKIRQDIQNQKQNNDTKKSITMEKQKVEIRQIEKITHDTLRIVTDKPEGFQFIPGQATEVFIDKEGWRDEGRPFTFISLPEDDFLEFVIKTYPEKDGATDKLLDLVSGDHLFVKDIFGAIQYKGKGTFLAAGAGITPFLAIFRQLEKENKLQGNYLYFSNKTADDIIMKETLESMLGENITFLLSREDTSAYEKGKLDDNYLKKVIQNTDQYFYICGPWDMVDSIQQSLMDLGVAEDKIVREE